MTMTKVCKLPHVIPVFQSVHKVLSVNWWINNQQIYHIQSEVYFGSHLFDIGSGRLEWSVTSTIVKNLWTLGTQSVPLCHVTRPLTDTNFVSTIFRTCISTSTGCTRMFLALGIQLTVLRIPLISTLIVRFRRSRPLSHFPLLSPSPNT